MSRTSILLLMAGGTLLLGSCGPSDDEESRDGRMGIFVSVLPQAYFAHRLGGELVSVDVLVGPGQDPHLFAPTQRQMRSIEKAKIYFRIGMPFEETVCRKLASMYEDLRIVDMLEGIAVHDLDADHHEGAHHDNDEHHGQMDPHVWMSPKLAKVLAGTMCEALCNQDAEHADTYRKNFKELEADLTRLDEKIATALKPLKGRTFYVFHPAFSYFAESYGLQQKAVETGGKAPAAKQVQALVRQARAEGVKVIFVQPQYSQSAAKVIASEIGGAVVPIDPLAKDYVSNLAQVAQKVREALSAQESQGP